MIDLNVVFQIPEIIAVGLQNGTLERVGGVIRNSATKKVVAWLKEGEGVQLEAPSNKLLGQLQTLSMNSNILMGMQVANLAVSAAGFALLYQKLGVIERKIDALRDLLAQVKDGQAWQEEKQFLEYLAQLRVGMQSLEEMDSYSDPREGRSNVMQIDNSVLRAQNYFALVISRIHDKQESYKRSEELALTYRAWVMAGQLGIQIMSRLGERTLAHDRARSFQGQHALFGKNVLAQLQDTHHRVLNNDQSGQRFAALKGIAAQASQAHEILRGNTLQLELIKDEQLVLPPVPKASGNRDGLLLYLYT